MYSLCILIKCLYIYYNNYKILEKILADGTLFLTETVVGRFFDKNM